MSVEAHLAAWADVVSFLLLGITIVIAGGVDPRRRTWGRSLLRNILLITSLSINIIYSVGRLIVEGILVETGPREFLLLSVVYCLRWLWLYVAISRSGSRSAKAFQVAQALRELTMIRLGNSSHDDNQGIPKKKSSIFNFLRGVKKKSEGSTNEARWGEPELVVRKGSRSATGKPYWRGFEESVQFIERKATHKVVLIEQELHAHVLDEIGTVAFRKEIETASPDHLYKMFYDLVMTVDAKNPDLEVNYGPFLEKTQPVVTADSLQSNKVGATDPSDLGNVARKVAADACYYIWHSGEALQLRTPNQVRLINACLEDAVKGYFGSDTNV